MAGKNVFSIGDLGKFSVPPKERMQARIAGNLPTLEGWTLTGIMSIPKYERGDKHNMVRCQATSVPSWTLAEVTHSEHGVRLVGAGVAKKYLGLDNAEKLARLANEKALTMKAKPKK